MHDFTLTTYRVLLEKYLDNGYYLCSYEDYLARTTDERTAILRHDVDKKPFNALQTARLESKLGVNATYYFRIVNESFDEEIIRKIAALGHEIGYHYEDLTLCRGNFEQAIDHFKNRLEAFRKLYPVKTICMHGSPLSRWDNRLLWGKYRYQELGVIAEPYFDLNFDEVLYLTDTGRSWNGAKVSVRDKVNSSFKYPDFHSTFEMITSLRQGYLPAKVMINTHPQRWSDNFVEWTIEYISQNTKNVAKKVLINRRMKASDEFKN